MASASTLDASSASGGFVSERVFPIRIHLVTEGGRVREALASLASASIVQKGDDNKTSLPASKSSSRPSSTSSQGKVEDDALAQDLPSPSSPHTFSERITMVSSSRSKSVSVQTSHGPATFHRCEDEPIHIPGAIQRFGALVALTPLEDGAWSVRIASENCKDVLGYEPEQLFKLTSFANILYDESSRDFCDSAEAVWEGRFSQREETQLEISSVALKPRHGKFNTLWCAMHIAEGDSTILICEFEDQPQGDNRDSRRAASHTAPAGPISSSQQHVTHTNADSHLRALRAARLRRAHVNVLDTFNAVADIQRQLSATETVQELLELVAGMVRELTQFHRVMLYQFDKSANGSVVAESVDPAASEDRYHGLHFPHADIPKQARELYKVNKIRVLYSRDEETARLVCNTPQDALRPLDLTHSYLRAMSPIHLKYLANMKVCASMSISLIVNKELWGLIVCHSYIPMRIQLPLRELCRTLGTSASTNITKLLYASRLEHRKLLITGSGKATPSALVTASSSDLLRIFDADFGLLAIDGEVRAIGKLDPYVEAMAVLNFVNHQQFDDITMSDHMAADYPNEGFLASADIIAGMLVVPLSKDRSDFIVFLRCGQIKDLHWAGNPNEKDDRPGLESHLEPRSSFKRWTQQVRGTSRAWTVDQYEMALVLRLIYGRFIEVWRQKGRAVQKTKMTRILLRNASHEVRTPLNAIINYTELALYGEVTDKETRENLENSLRASHSLIYVIEDLLNLAAADEGDVLMPEEHFDLSRTVDEVVEVFAVEAQRRGTDLVFSNKFTRPGALLGDSRRFREVVSHLINNAFQHAGNGTVTIGMRSLTEDDDAVLIEIAVEDCGAGMSEKDLDNLFQYFELINNDDSESDSSSDNPGTKSPINLGLGLAVVSRFVRNTKGHLRIRSEIGKGTTVAIIVPFRVARDRPIRTSGSLLTPPQERLPLIFGSRGSSITGFHEQTSSIRTLGLPGSSVNAKLTVPDILSPPLSAHVGHSNISERGSGTSTSSPLQSVDLVSPYQEGYPFPSVNAPQDQTPYRHLSVLIAEDNPINSRMLEHRLSKLGHTVHVATNGQACVDVFATSVEPFDVILMDIQMPLLNGFQATERIRLLESQSQSQKSTSTTPPADPKPRTPIIAISASLEESRKDEYSQTGVDGWMLKPVNFRRLERLLKGIHDEEVKSELRYQTSTWELGGWLVT